MSELTIRGLAVRYGGARNAFQALTDVNLDVESGTFVTLLGPSGSGKTTLLRCVAGLVMPSGGRIEAGNRLFVDAASETGLQTRERNLGMVFQAFALWPHMTVAENVAFPLRMRGLERRKQQLRVEELLQLVGLPGLGARYPAQLSGGQQQRVGLARAICCQPSILLMDEPLSGLDARLREEMRSYIRRLQNELGITVVYVTHDREEALGLSDVIVILSNGRIVSVGPPRELFQDPQDAFTANFLSGWNRLGSPQDVRSRGGEWLKELALGIPETDGSDHVVMLPTDMKKPLKRTGRAQEARKIPAEVLNVEFLGTSVRLELRLPGVETSLFVSQAGSAADQALKTRRGDTVELPAEAFRLLPQSLTAPPAASS